MKAKKTFFYALLGVLIGLGAPGSHVLLRMYQTGGGLFSSFLAEFHDHGFLLSLLPAPMIVGFFGFLLGRFQDHVQLQKENLERMAVKFERQSMTDDLTGLYNHRHILVEIDREVERANRYGRMLSGMMIDLDDFKKVNDEHGHLAGDRLLAEVADVLQRSIRKVDILGRYGGDEFLVILPETDLETSRIVAERIRKNICQQSFRTDDTPLAVTVSIGLFSFPANQKLDLETFINQADQVLLKAKRSGKDQIFSGHA